MLALLLLGVAAVLAQDAWTRLRDGSGTASTWLGSVISGLDGLAPSSAVAAAAALAAVLGLLLVLAAFSRRTRRALVLRGDLGAHLTTRDVARLAAGAARQVDGVLEASAAATRRKVTVEVTTTGDDATRSDVQREVERALSALSSAPRVTTTAKEANR